MEEEKAKRDIVDGLVIKSLKKEDLEQFNDLLKYVFQVTPSMIKESGYIDEREVINHKYPILKNTDAIGWFKGDKVISTVNVYHCKANIHGKIMKMAQLTNVATYPEFSNMGLAKKLISLALKKMREEEQWISYLYPMSIPYYRKKGWEIICEYVTYTVKDYQLPKKINVRGHVERVNVEDNRIKEFYNEYSKNRNGAIIRDEFLWDEYWRWEDEEKANGCIYYDENNKVTGYLIYEIHNGTFNVRDLIYLNYEARVGLWNFISAHDSMINVVKGKDYGGDRQAFFFENSAITETVKPYFMGRIVDVDTFLKNMNFKSISEPFHFVVTDDMAEWNNGVFSVEHKDGNIFISNKEIGHRVELNIQTMTTMLMSYKRPRYLSKLERINASAEAIEVLERAIPVSKPYYSDWF